MFFIFIFVCVYIFVAKDVIIFLQTSSHYLISLPSFSILCTRDTKKMQYFIDFFTRPGRKWHAWAPRCSVADVWRATM